MSKALDSLLGEHGLGFVDQIYDHEDDPPFAVRPTLIGVTTRLAKVPTSRPILAVQQVECDHNDFDYTAYAAQTSGRVKPGKITSASVRHALKRFVRAYRLRIEWPAGQTPRARDEPAFFISSNALGYWCAGE